MSMNRYANAGPIMAGLAAWGRQPDFAAYEAAYANDVQTAYDRIVSVAPDGSRYVSHEAIEDFSKDWSLVSLHFRVEHQTGYWDRMLIYGPLA